MNKPPASIRIYQDLGEMEVICEGLDVTQYDREYEYIRRDLFEAIINAYHIRQNLGTLVPLNEIIDDFIKEQSEQ